MPLTSRPPLPPLSRPLPPAPARSGPRRCASILAAVFAAAPFTAATVAAHPAPQAGAARGCAYAHLMPTRSNIPLVSEAIVCLINQRRQAAGLAPLLPAPALYQAAERHSLSMVAGDYFAHTGPSGRTPAQRMRAAGFTCHASCPMGENIAWGTGSAGTASSIVDLWMGSAGHRANILRRSFRVQGLGVALGAPARGWRHRAATTVTEDFGAS
jgi:uncharacterized protein YkwD